METSKEVDDTTRVYQKGPEFLRKQMELESEIKEGMSAVERLAASKQKYVKSQQVINATQVPVIHMGSASVSSNGSSNRSKGSRKSGNRILGRNATAVAGEEPVHPPELDVVRRSSSKKRPDSLLLYRQKCDLLKGTSKNERNKRHLGNRSLHSTLDRNGPLLEATNGTSEGNKTGFVEGITTGSVSDAVGAQSGKLLTQHSYTTDKGDTNSVLSKPMHNRVAEVKKRSSKGVSRSHSDISSRYSKNFADFDAFFQYCGLDGEMIQSLGKENFSAHSDEAAIRSVSVSSSDGEFSRNSGDSDGLLEEELSEKIHQGTSVIERNARIIKWLYSCRNAKETGKKLRELD